MSVMMSMEGPHRECVCVRVRARIVSQEYSLERLSLKL